MGSVYPLIFPRQIFPSEVRRKKKRVLRESVLPQYINDMPKSLKRKGEHGKRKTKQLRKGPENVSIRE